MGALVRSPDVAGIIGAGGDDGSTVLHMAEDQAFAKFAADAFGDLIVPNFCHNVLAPGSKAVLNVS